MGLTFCFVLFSINKIKTFFFINKANLFLMISQVLPNSDSKPNFIILKS